MKKVILTAALLAALAPSAWAYGSCGVCYASGGYAVGSCIQCGIERLFFLIDDWR